MVKPPVYLDNHATTRVDLRVIEAMLPLFSDTYGNPGSVNHVFGWDAQDEVKQARHSIAEHFRADANEIVFTSGATESNNHAIRGVCERKRRRGNHVISATTEHHAILDPLDRLKRAGFDVTLLDVAPQNSPHAGSVNPADVAAAIRDETCLVTVMLANNEIGTISDIAAIGAACRQREVAFHTDATQAVGRIPIDVSAMNIDLMSFSAHKFYGPKGIGGLYINKTSRPKIRLEPLMVGGGQENGSRAGTLNVPGIVGMATALDFAVDEMESENKRLSGLRQHLFERLTGEIEAVQLNGPTLLDADLRLCNNLNVSFTNVDGEALMMSMRDIAVSSGSACSSANPEPSHVLRAIGLSDDLARASLRFGLGRFNTLDEIDFAVDLVKQSVARLRALKTI